MRVRWPIAVLLLAAPACLPAIAAWCPSCHWSLDLAANFPVQAFLWLTLATISLAIGRKWWPTGVAAAFAAVAGAALLAGDGLPNNSPPLVENAPRIRVMTLNLLHSNHNGGPRALEVVRQQQPDVLFCGEFTPGWRNRIAAALRADYPHHQTQTSLGSFGVAVFSRWPLRSAEVLPLAHSWAPTIRAVVQTPYGDIGLLGVHTPPPGLGARRVGERDAAIAAIARLCADLPARRIVMGDFNAARWNAPFRRMLRDAGIGDGTHRSWLPSWPHPLPLPFRIAIDHVLVGGGLAIADAQLGPGFGSDHLPLSAVVQLPPAN